MQISIKRFIELTVRNFDGFTEDITLAEAQACRTEDKAEVFCHVVETTMGGKTTYRLWAKPDWEIHEDNRRRKTNLNRAMQQRFDRENRNIAKVVAYLVHTSGLDARTVTPMAQVMLHRNAQQNPILQELGLEYDTTNTIQS